jgi:Domain of unknown function (DUF4340)
MKIRGLLASVIVLAALGGVLYWSNRKQKAEAAKPSTSTAPKILDIPQDQIREIRIQKTGAEPTVLRKGDDGKWQIVDPKPLRADQDAVTSMVSTLSSLNADKLVEAKAPDLSPFGLNSPNLEITVVKKDGKSQQLEIGDDTPTSSGAYVKLAGDPRVFTVYTYVKTSLDKTPDDLRDKRLLTFDQDKLTRVDLQTGNQTIEFGKNNQNDWEILKPKPLRADGSQVEDLISKLKNAKMDTSVTPEDARKAAAAFASGTRVAIATVADANGTQQLEVRKDKDKNYYAKGSAVAGVYKVTSDLGDGLDKKLDDFRNKKIFDFAWNDPNKLQVGKATYDKVGEKWMSGGKQMDSPSVQSVVDKLRDLSATKFLDSGGGGTPVLDLMVSSNNGKRVEKVSITKQGDTYFAKRENEPSIYQLDSKAVEDLQKAASEVKPFQPPKKK